MDLTLESSIEFVLIGPSEGRDVVLVRSIGAGADLVGFAVERGFDYDLESSSSLRFIIAPSQRMMNLVESDAIEAQDDDRSSRHLLAWVGYCSRNDRRVIAKKFRGIVHSIEYERSAFQFEGTYRGENLRDIIEWHLGPVLYECHRANENGKRRIELTRLLAFSYGAMVTIAVALAGAWVLLRSVG